MSVQFHHCEKVEAKLINSRGLGSRVSSRAGGCFISAGTDICLVLVLLCRHLLFIQKNNTWIFGTLCSDMKAVSQCEITV